MNKHPHPDRKWRPPFLIPGTALCNRLELEDTAICVDDQFGYRDDHREERIIVIEDLNIEGDVRVRVMSANDR